MRAVLLSTLLLTTTSCSYFDKDSGQDKIVEHSKFSITESEDGRVLELSDNSISYVASELKDKLEREDFLEYNDSEEKKDASRTIASVVSSEEEILPTRFEQYTVQKGDTLMKIAFKFYQNVDMWKKISKWNSDSVTDNKIFPGMKINLHIKDSYGRAWMPIGTPYVIQRGDTLGGISANVYHGYARYWADIYDNNKPLIKNPSIIYAGFTIYYPAYDDIRINRALAWNDKKAEDKTVALNDQAEEKRAPASEE